MNRISQRAGYGLLGLLITLVCIVVLFAISMSALNKAITGEGSPREGTVRSTQDMIQLNGLYQSMLAGSRDFQDSRYLVPSIVSRSGDRSEDTTANLYSAMVAMQYTRPESLISGNEYNHYVVVKDDYDYSAYAPDRGSFWDTSFKADLHDLANVSFAHMPLYGERYRRGWRATHDARTILVGNRGPEDGRDDPYSYTYGRDGVWGGHVLYGDGHIRFHTEFTPPGLTYERDGQSHPDNLFYMDDGPDGRDAILSFTREMRADGPVLQYD